jgi:hypothetical protein
VLPPFRNLKLHKKQEALHRLLKKIKDVQRTFLVTSVCKLKHVCTLLATKLFEAILSTLKSIFYSSSTYVLIP